MTSLKEIFEKLESDERNQSYTQRGIHPVFQVDPKAKVLLIGQAPGRKVEESGIPFLDQSGKTLMSWLGISPELFYSNQIAILPMDFYYPGKGRSGDLPPRKFIAKEYHEDLLKLMPDISLTILIGRYSVNYYLGDRQKPNLTQTVQAFQDYLPQYFPIVHPSPLNMRWQKKNPWYLEDVVPALQDAVARSLGG